MSSFRIEVYVVEDDMFLTLLVHRNNDKVARAAVENAIPDGKITKIDLVRSKRQAKGLLK